MRLTAALALLAAAPAWADPMTGNEFLELKRTNLYEAHYFVRGLIEGYGMALVVTQSKTPATNKSTVASSIDAAQMCIPDVTLGQLTDVFVKSLESNPASRHLPAAVLAYSAYMKAWPCPPK